GPIPAGSPIVIATRGLVIEGGAVQRWTDGLSPLPARAGPAVPTAAAAARRVVAPALAAAAAVHLPFRVRQLVSQTTFEPAAEARQLRRVEAEVLLLGHLDRYGLERREEGRAAQRPSAGAVAAHQLRFVAHAD